LVIHGCDNLNNNGECPGRLCLPAMEHAMCPPHDSPTLLFTQQQWFLSVSSQFFLLLFGSSFRLLYRLPIAHNVLG
jgi:hypothetical protein